MTLFIKNRNCYWTVVWNLCNTPDRSSSFSVEPVLLAQEVTNKTVAVVISKTLKILSELRVLKSSFLSEDDRINSMKYTSWYNDINAINMIYSTQQINLYIWDFIGIYLWSELRFLQWNRSSVTEKSWNAFNKQFELESWLSKSSKLYLLSDWLVVNLMVHLKIYQEKPNTNISPVLYIS